MKLKVVSFSICHFLYANDIIALCSILSISVKINVYVVNNVPSWLSSQWLCGYTVTQMIYGCTAGTSEPKSAQQAKQVA